MHLLEAAGHSPFRWRRDIVAGAGVTAGCEVVGCATPIGREVFVSSTGRWPGGGGVVKCNGLLFKLKFLASRSRAHVFFRRRRGSWRRTSPPSVSSLPPRHPRITPQPQCARHKYSGAVEGRSRKLLKSPKEHCKNQWTDLHLRSYPKHVWSPAGGWYAQPANWRANTAIMGAVVVGVCLMVGSVSAEREHRNKMPDVRRRTRDTDLKENKFVGWHFPGSPKT